MSTFESLDPRAADTDRALRAHGRRSTLRRVFNRYVVGEYPKKEEVDRHRWAKLEPSGRTFEYVHAAVDLTRKSGARLEEVVSQLWPTIELNGRYKNATRPIRLEPGSAEHAAFVELFGPSSDTGKPLDLDAVGFTIQEFDDTLTPEEAAVCAQVVGVVAMKDEIFCGFRDLSKEEMNILPPGKQAAIVAAANQIYQVADLIFGGIKPEKN